MVLATVEQKETGCLHTDTANLFEIFGRTSTKIQPLVDKLMDATTFHRVTAHLTLHNKIGDAGQIVFFEFGEWKITVQRDEHVV